MSIWRDVGMREYEHVQNERSTHTELVTSFCLQGWNYSARKNSFQAAYKTIYTVCVSVCISNMIRSGEKKNQACMMYCVILQCSGYLMKTRDSQASKGGKDMKKIEEK